MFGCSGAPGISVCTAVIEASVLLGEQEAFYIHHASPIGWADCIELYSTQSQTHTWYKPSDETLEQGRNR